MSDTEYLENECEIDFTEGELQEGDFHEDSPGPTNEIELNMKEGSVDVVQDTSENAMVDVEANESAEFLGSSLSGKSIYAPPKVHRPEEQCSQVPLNAEDEQLPEWKKKLVEKKREEQERYEREQEEEKAKWANLPDWKRKLLEAKTSKERTGPREEREESPSFPLVLPGSSDTSARAAFWGVKLRKTRPATEEGVTAAAADEVDDVDDSEDEPEA